MPDTLMEESEFLDPQKEKLIIDKTKQAITSAIEGFSTKDKNLSIRYLIPWLMRYQTFALLSDPTNEENWKLWSDNTMFETEFKSKIQSYINKFRLDLGEILQPSVSQQYSVAGFNGGVILNIKLSEASGNSDNFLGVVESFDAVAKLQGLAREDFNDEAQFDLAVRENKLPSEGTHIILKAGKIFILKDNTENIWSLSEEFKDASHVVEALKNRRDRKSNKTAPLL